MIKAQSGEGPEFFITGDIGYEVDGGDLLTQLSYYKGQEVTFTIFSFGGAVYPAIAVYEYIRDNGIKATANIYGICASAATIFAAAAGPKRTYISPHSQFMTHAPYGGEDKARELAEEAIINIYMDVTKWSRRKVVKTLMEGDNFFSANEMADMGFGQVMDEMAIAASYKAKIQNTEDMSEENTKVSLKAIKLSLKDLVNGEVEIDPQTINNEVIATLQQELDDAIEANKDTAKQVDDLKSELEEAKVELKAEYDELEANYKAKEEALDSANEELKAANETIKELEASIGEQAQEIAALKKEPLTPKAESSGDEVQEPGSQIAEEGKTERELSPQEARIKRIAEAQNAQREGN